MNLNDTIDRIKQELSDNSTAEIEYLVGLIGEQEHIMLANVKIIEFYKKENAKLVEELCYREVNSEVTK